MLDVVSSIPLNGLMLFFCVGCFLALFIIVKLRSDGRQVRASWFGYGVVGAAVASFITCVGLNYSSMQPKGPARAVRDDETYEVYDMHTGDTKEMKGRQVKARYGSDVREDGTRPSDDGTTLGQELADQVRAHEAEQAQTGNSKLVP